MDLRSRIKAILAEHGAVTLDQLDEMTDRILAAVEAYKVLFDSEAIAEHIIRHGW